LRSLEVHPAIHMFSRVDLAGSGLDARLGCGGIDSQLGFSLDGLGYLGLKWMDDMMVVCLTISGYQNRQNPDPKDGM